MLGVHFFNWYEQIRLFNSLQPAHPFRILEEATKSYMRAHEGINDEQSGIPIGHWRAKARKVVCCMFVRRSEKVVCVVYGGVKVFGVLLFEA